ncbi:hypothetical protein VKT23_018293 [Stygiomarasmius scandens]|uniref:F-box domain-containing protein n=1 Tax=Marasmiellus scandens TaxID=2682957 RepID=A0ABR1ISA0_9AGAR
MFPEPEKLEDPAIVATLLEWTRHCPERSQNQPIEIVFQSLFDDYQGFSGYRCMNPFIDLLLEESQRWRRVHLSLYSSQIEELSLPKTLPSLELFHLHVADLSQFSYNLPPIVAPRLQELVFSDMLLPPNSEIPKFEVSVSPNLTNLYLSHVSVYSALQYLAQAPPTVSVNADLAFYYQGPLMTVPITSRTSALTTVSGGDLTTVGLNDPLCDLFNNITSLPNVHLFDFTGNRCQGGPFPHASFISFLSRRRPDETPITKLSFKRWIFEDESLLQILNLLPALEHLTINENFSPALYNPFYYQDRTDRTLSDSFLRALCIPANRSASKCILPRLKNLTLIFEKEVDYEAVEDLIRSRRRDSQCTGLGGVNVSRLDHVSISVPRKLADLEDIEMLQMMDGVIVKSV